MTVKGMMVAAWAGLAIVVHGFQDGDIPELFALVNGGGPGAGKGTVGKPGLMYRLLGQFLFFGTLTLLSNYSDEAANYVLLFMLGLTLVYLVNNRVALQPNSIKL